MRRADGRCLVGVILMCAALLVGVGRALGASPASAPFELGGAQMGAAIAYGREAVNTQWDQFVRPWTVSNPSNDTTARLETPFFLLAMHARRAAAAGRIFTESDAWSVVLNVKGKLQFALLLRAPLENSLQALQVRLHTPDGVRQPWLIGPQPIRPPTVRREGNAFVGEATVPFLARGLERGMTVELEIVWLDGRSARLPFPLGEFR